MDLKDYQLMTKRTAIYPGRGTLGGLMYCSLGLAGEAGEVANKVKKIYRSLTLKPTSPLCGNLDGDVRAKLIDELGDVLWYVSEAAQQLDTNLDELTTINAHKLLSRQERNTLEGSGDER